MAFRLVVKDTVGVTIKGKYVNEAGKDKDFKFTLVCDRLDQDAMKEAIGDGKTTVDFLEQHATDWQGQTLVLDEDDKPAPFSLEALRVLMSMTGMANLCWNSYLQQVQAVAKN